MRGSAAASRAERRWPGRWPSCGAGLPGTWLNTEPSGKWKPVELSSSFSGGATASARDGAFCAGLGLTALLSLAQGASDRAHASVAAPSCITLEPSNLGRRRFLLTLRPHPPKPFKTYSELVELLRLRGMEIADCERAERKLSQIGYYRLSGFWYSCRELVVDASAKSVLDERTRKPKGLTALCLALLSMASLSFIFLIRS